nr:skin secretory protein xP2-like [Microcebus murinus]
MSHTRQEVTGHPTGTAQQEPASPGHRAPLAQRPAPPSSEHVPRGGRGRCRRGEARSTPDAGASGSVCPRPQRSPRPAVWTHGLRKLAGLAGVGAGLVSGRAEADPSWWQNQGRSRSPFTQPRRPPPLVPTPAGGDRAISTPAGGDRAAPTPAGGDRAIPTPAGGDRDDGISLRRTVEFKRETGSNAGGSDHWKFFPKVFNQNYLFGYGDRRPGAAVSEHEAQRCGAPSLCRAAFPTRISGTFSSPQTEPRPLPAPDTRQAPREWCQALSVSGTPVPRLRVLSPAQPPGNGPCPAAPGRGAERPAPSRPAGLVPAVGRRSPPQSPRVALCVSVRVCHGAPAEPVPCREGRPSRRSLGGVRAALACVAAQRAVAWPSLPQRAEPAPAVWPVWFPWQLRDHAGPGRSVRGHSRREATDAAHAAACPVTGLCHSAECPRGTSVLCHVLSGR